MWVWQQRKSIIDYSANKCMYTLEPFDRFVDNMAINDFKLALISLMAGMDLMQTNTTATLWTSASGVSSVSGRRQRRNLTRRRSNVYRCKGPFLNPAQEDLISVRARWRSFSSTLHMAQITHRDSKLTTFHHVSSLQAASADIHLLGFHYPPVLPRRRGPLHIRDSAHQGGPPADSLQSNWIKARRIGNNHDIGAETDYWTHCTISFILITLFVF